MRTALEQGRSDRNNRRLQHSYSLKSSESYGSHGAYYSSVSTAVSTKSDITSQASTQFSFSYEDKYLDKLCDKRSHSSSELRLSIGSPSVSSHKSEPTCLKPRSASSTTLPSKGSKRRALRFEFRKCMNCNIMYASSEKEALKRERWDVRWKYCSGECHVMHISRTHQAQNKPLHLGIDQV